MTTAKSTGRRRKTSKQDTPAETNIQAVTEETELKEQPKEVEVKEEPKKVEVKEEPKTAKPKEKVVNTLTKQLKVCEREFIGSQGYKLKVTNVGGGDAYVGTQKEPVPSDKTLLAVGKSKTCNDNLHVFAYSRPTLKIEFID